MTPAMENLYKEVIGHWPMPTLNDQDAADHILQHVQDRHATAVQDVIEDESGEGEYDALDFYVNDLNMPSVFDFLNWDDDTQARYREDLLHAHDRALLYGKQRA